MAFYIFIVLEYEPNTTPNLNNISISTVAKGIAINRHIKYNNGLILSTESTSLDSSYGRTKATS